MKRPVKLALIALMVIIGLLILVAGGFFLRFYLATRNMTPAETSKLNDTVFCVKDHFVNAYLFKGKTGYLLVDAGYDKETFAVALRSLGIDQSKITTLLLTHTDGDHIAATGLFPKARVMMHRGEEQMINGTNGKMFFLRPHWEFQAYELFDTNDTLKIDGLKIKVLHTPGHTPGSCCFLVGNDYLVTADNLVYQAGQYLHFNDAFNMDTRQQEISIRSLPEPGTVKFILTAHNGITRIRRE